MKESMRNIKGRDESRDELSENSRDFRKNRETT